MNTKKDKLDSCCKECSTKRYVNWRNTNYNHALQANRKSALKWRTEKPFKNVAKTARYTANKLKATPSWLTESHNLQIQCKYSLAQMFSRETGIQHHVDHIVPLKGKTVCGLHVPWNLRVIPAVDNLRKSNKI